MSGGITLGQSNQDGFNPDDYDVEQDVEYNPEEEINNALAQRKEELHEELSQLKDKYNEIQEQIAIREYKASERQFGEKAAFVADVLGDRFLGITNSRYIEHDSESDYHLIIERNDGVLPTLFGQEPAVTVTVEEDYQPDRLVHEGEGARLVNPQFSTDVYQAVLDDEAEERVVREVTRTIPQEEAELDWEDTINELYQEAVEVEKEQVIATDSEIQHLEKHLEQRREDIEKIIKEERLL